MSLDETDVATQEQCQDERLAHEEEEEKKKNANE